MIQKAWNIFKLHFWLKYLQSSPINVGPIFCQRELTCKLIWKTEQKSKQILPGLGIKQMSYPYTDFYSQVWLIILALLKQFCPKMILIVKEALNSWMRRNIVFRFTKRRANLSRTLMSIYFLLFFQHTFVCSVK